jgi:hypothetical protein
MTLDDGHDQELVRDMNRRRFTALLIAAAVAVSGLALTTATAPAALAKCTQEDQDADRCPVPPTTTTRPSPPPSMLTVSTYSVTATATVQYASQPGEVTVLWGDGTGTTLFDSRIPAGQVVLSHRYALSEDGRAFPVSITARVDARSETRVVTVVPRWGFSQTNTKFTALEHCDTGLEDETEFRVDQQVWKNGQIYSGMNWRFERNIRTAGDHPDADRTIRLADLYLELTRDESVTEVFHAVEMDPISDDDAARGEYPLRPWATDFSSVRFVIESDDCDSRIDVEIVMLLLH